MMKIAYLSFGILACSICFIVGLKFSKVQTTTSNHSYSNPSSNTYITFDVPKVVLSPNWSSKENLPENPGNSFSTANPLSAGVKTQGTLNNNNSIDYYTFSIKNPSQIIVSITDVPKSLYWILYDEKLKVVASTFRMGSLQGTTQIALQNPGKYYIKVWADYSQVTNYPYTIMLDILPYFE